MAVPPPWPASCPSGPEVLSRSHRTGGGIWPPPVLGLTDSARTEAPSDLSSLEARNDKPARGASGADQLLLRHARPRPEVRKVTLHGARPDPNELRRIGH